MAKFQLTISPRYCSNWGVWEGCREVIQNALDSADDGNEMSVTHHGETLRVSNQGVRLDPKVWLMGTSGKSTGGYRGHFGEGLKLGCLALVRAGHDVKIVNGDESWTPKLEPSEVFGDDVLTVYTHKRQTDTGAFTVEIGGVDKEAWDLMRQRFLFLAKPDKTVETSRATVLLDDALRGKVFVKGIFVQNSPDLVAGYDFKGIETDRDRRMVSSWDLRYHAAKAWEEAATRGGDDNHKARLLEMLSQGSPDVAALGDSWVEKGTSEAIAAAFVEQHGDNAVPVTSMAAAREVEHYGLRGVVVQPALLQVLKNEQSMNMDSIRDRFSRSVQKTHGWSDLTEEERQTYKVVVDMVEAASRELGFGAVEDRLAIVEFGDQKLCGLYEGGQVRVARRMLSNLEEFLATLVHEVAHAAGGDGSVGHERAEGVLFSRIIAMRLRS